MNLFLFSGPVTKKSLHTGSVTELQSLKSFLKYNILQWQWSIQYYFFSIYIWMSDVVGFSDGKSTQPQNFNIHKTN